ncbi:MAG: chloride channel protein [Acidobacteriota bacterium]
MAFHESIRMVESMLLDPAEAKLRTHWMLWVLAVPTIGGLVSGALLQYVVPEARGSGIPQVKVAYAQDSGKLPFHVSIGKFFIGVIQIGTGSSLGREGPTVQICAGIASLFGGAAALSRQGLRRMLPVGAAAGIAAAFNAPIAAVTFAIEEIIGDLDQAVLSGVIVAAALAAVIERSILGQNPVLHVGRQYSLQHPTSLILYALLGVVAAFVSMLFTDSLLILRDRFKRLNAIPGWMHPAIGGLTTGALAVVALRWLNVDGVTGGGYRTLSTALSGNLAVKALLLLCIMKLVATVVSYSSGGAGGIFAPALFIGGMLGGAVGYLDHLLLASSSEQVGAFALVGMGAVFAGIVRAPITSVLIIFEMTNSYGLILPLMIANMSAYALARRYRPTPIYEALIQQDGIQLPHRRSRINPLDRLPVAAVMTTKAVTILPGSTVDQALEKVATSEYNIYPVVSADGGFAGFIQASRLRLERANGNGGEAVSSFAWAGEAVNPDVPTTRAAVKLNQSGIHLLAVVAPDEKRTFLGLLTSSDIVRAHADAAPDRTEDQAKREGSRERIPR